MGQELIITKRKIKNIILKSYKFPFKFQDNFKWIKRRFSFTPAYLEREFRR